VLRVGTLLPMHGHRPQLIKRGKSNQGRETQLLLENFLRKVRTGHKKYVSLKREEKFSLLRKREKEMRYPVIQK